MAAKLRLAFMGTPDFAVPILEALVAAGHELAAVYTQPPRPTGRGHRTQPSPVQARAEALGIPAFHPTSLKPAEAQEAFAALALDAAVVAAYGLILPKPILAAPRLGCINVHASLLPRWRGAAPIQRALLAGDSETGVTIMQMEAGLDTGPMLLRGTVPIGPASTASSLHDALSAMGAKLIIEALDGLAAGTLAAMPQPEEGVTYAAKLEREEGEIDWHQDAATLERKVRALTPWPGVSFSFESERVKVLAAISEPDSGGAAPGTVIDNDLGIACTHGVFRPVLLQRPGRGIVQRRAFLNGTPIKMGISL
ncbi:MAG TPA: methionyl-tRNA formyltransferase [Aliidongia sp.]|nr:methionyl-tRNA formyltransferase [Aliidongia sp.]